MPRPTREIKEIFEAESAVFFSEFFSDDPQHIALSYPRAAASAHGREGWCYHNETSIARLLYSPYLAFFVFKHSAEGRPLDALNSVP